MTKLDKIKEHFIINNIVDFSHAHGTIFRKNQPKVIETLIFYKPNSIRFSDSVSFIICIENKNTSYFIDFLHPKKYYHKIGDFKKGIKLINEIMLYYSSGKYNNCQIFLDSQKQKFNQEGLENIRKYEIFWEQKISEYTQIPKLIDRLNHNLKLQRKIKLKKLNNENRKEKNR